MPLTLDSIVSDIARGIKLVDATHPVALNARSGTPYQAGIGPHTESKTTKLVFEALALSDGSWADYQLDVPYGTQKRQSCDVCLRSGTSWEWAIEIKMLRLLGDNGKINDNIFMHILSPYPAQRSALTDCEKLVDSDLAPHKAVVIYGYDYSGWPMDPIIEEFEVLASRRVVLGPRSESSFGQLIHPVHERGRVFGWELLQRA